MASASIARAGLATDRAEIRFNPWSWAAGVSALCLLPLVMMGFGFDFSTHLTPLLLEDTAGMSQATLSEAVHAAARGSYTHTLLEWTATASAFFIFALAFMQYRLTRESSLMIIGVALCCAGAMDAFHTLAADRLIAANSDNRDLIPFTWAICRLFNACIQLVGVSIVVFSFSKNARQMQPITLMSISLAFVFTGYLLVDYCANSASLPQTMFPDATIKRPYDIYPILPYLISALFVFPRYLKQHRNVFAYMLLIALIPDIATELYMAFGSTGLHDSAFNVAHALKAVSYIVPVIGLFIDYIHTYAKQAQLAEEKQVLIASLEEAVEEAKRASRVKSEFLANMSHELRTPMNSIMGFTKRLIRRLGGEIGERDLDALQTVDRNAEHLLHLINDILDLSKIEAGRMELEYQDFDLATTLQSVRSQLSPMAEAKHLRLDLSLPDDSALRISADPTKCLQMITNLTSNAIKYSDEGQVSLRLSRGEDPELGAVARIQVKDTGVGILAEDLERIFQRFTQVDQTATRKTGGTGLGLVITKHYVELHGGRLEVESEPGNGSEFTLIIPLAPSAGRKSALENPNAPVRATVAKAAEPPSPPAAVAESETAGTGTALTVLCVDDEPDVLKYLHLTFADAGYNVCTAMNFDEALSQARAHRPDAICLDIHLPGRDGYDVLQELRRDPALSTTPIIVVSIVAEEAQRLDCGACAYLAKPIEEGELLETVLMACANRVESALIVGDDLDTSQLIAMSLMEYGIDVHVAATGREALEDLVAHRPEVIVLDLMMPEMDGFEFLENIRSDPSWSKLPVVVLSAKTLTQEEYELLAGKTAAILTKGRGGAETLIKAVLEATRIS